MTFDGKSFGRDIVETVKGHIDKTMAPLLLQIEAMRKEIDALKSAPAPKDGKDADVADVAAMVTAGILPELKELRGMVEALPGPVELPDIPAMIAEALDAAKPEPVDLEALVDGVLASKVAPDIQKLRADLDAINPQIVEAIGGAIGEEIAEHVGKAVAALPVPLTADETKAMVAEAVAAIPPAENGKDADPAQMEEMAVRHVERLLADWEKPKDGKDGAAGEKGADGAAGRDGLDAMDVMVDREGQLVFTMSDGRMKNVGLVIGKDGEPGRDGSNGAPGKDGADGIGFDDLDLVETGAGIFLRCVRGDAVKEWRLPIMVYRGVFKEGHVYRKGDTVTWGGSLWHCDTEGTDDKPDGATKAWTLATKRGRDGKDGGTK